MNKVTGNGVNILHYSLYSKVVKIFLIFMLVAESLLGIITPKQANAVESYNSGDFIIEGNVIKGFSPQGLEKLKTNPDLVISFSDLGITEIGDNAFYQVKGINSIAIGGGITTIGSHAFQDTGLVSVILDGVKTIEDYAFTNNNINNLQENAVETYGVYSFRDNDLTILNTNATIIDKGAFMNNKLESITLNGIKEIREDAFNGNNLVNIDGSIKVNITSDTDYTIGTNVFDNNDALNLGEKVYIQSTFDKVSNNTDQYLINPIRVKMNIKDNETKNLITTRTSDTVYEKDDTPYTITVPIIDGYIYTGSTKTIDVTEQEVDLFYNKVTGEPNISYETTKKLQFKVGEVIDKNELLSGLILEDSLGNKGNISDVTTSVDSINTSKEGEYEVTYTYTDLSGKSDTLKVTYVVGLPSILDKEIKNGWVYGDFTYGNVVFSYNNIGTSVIGVTGLSSQGLAKYNSGNTDIVIPDINPYTRQPIISTTSGWAKFTSIDYSTSPNLKNIVNVSTKSGDGSPMRLYFDNPDALKISGMFMGYDFVDGIDFHGLENVTEISHSAFSSNTLTTIDLSGLDSLKKIGINAFYMNKTTGILDLSVVPNLEVIESQAFGYNLINQVNFEGLTNLKLIGVEAFKSNKITGNLDLSGLTSLTKIDSGAFAYNPSLTSVDFTGDTSLTIINNDAFIGDGLLNLDLTPLINLQTIGIGAFQNNKITFVNFEGLTKLTTIGGQSFYANSITSLDLSSLSSLTTIGPSAFYMNKIESLDLSNLSNLVTIDSGAFMYNPITGTIDLRDSTKLTTIGDSSFYNTKIDTLHLEGLSNLTKIGTTSFYGNRLTSIDFTGLTKLTTLGSQAFRQNIIGGEVDLTPLTNLTTIGNNVFSDNRITSMNMDNLNKITTFGVQIFSGNRFTDLDFTNQTLNWNTRNDMFLGNQTSLVNVTIDNINDFFIDETVAPNKITGNLTGIVNFTILNNDLNNDGVADKVSKPGEYLVNQYALTINYKDSEGNIIAPSETINSGDGQTITPRHIYGYTYTGGTVTTPLATIVNGETMAQSIDIIYNKDNTTIYNGDTSNITFNVDRTDTQTTIFTGGTTVSAAIKLSISGSTTTQTNRQIIAVLPYYVDSKTINVDVSSATSSIIKSYTIKDNVVTFNLVDGTGGDDLTLPITFKYQAFNTPKDYPGIVEAKYIIDGAVAATDTTTEYKPTYYTHALTTLQDSNTIHGTLTTDNNIEYVKPGTEKSLFLGYTVNQIYREYDNYTIKVKLPEYKAYENGLIVTKTPILDTELSPDWVVSEDGKYVSITIDKLDTLGRETISSAVNLGPSYGNYVYNFPEQKVYLKFPLAINNQVVTAQATSSFDINQEQYSDNLGVNTAYSSIILNVTENPDGMFGKANSEGDSRLATYLVDSDSKDKNFNWNIYYTPKNSTINGELYTPKYSTNVVLNDFSLDSRLVYNTVKANRDVTITAYSSVNIVDNSTTRRIYTPVESSNILTVSIKQGETYTFDPSIRNNIKFLKFDFKNEVFTGNEMANVSIGTKLKDASFVYNIAHRNYMSGSADLYSVNSITQQEQLQKVSGSLYADKLFMQSKEEVKATKNILNLPYGSVLGTSQPVVYSIGYNYSDTRISNNPTYINYSTNNQIKDFRQVDIVPNYLTVDSVKLSDYFIKIGAKYTMELLSDGRTKITITSPYAPEGVTNVATISTTLRDDSRPGTITNSTYISYSNTTITPLNTKAQTEFESGKLLSTATASFIFDRTLFMGGSKYIRTLDGGWTKEIKTLPGENFQYLLSLDNATSTQRTGTRILDIFPYKDDATLVENQQGLRISRESDFNNTFLGIKSITKISSTGVRTDVTNTVPVKYITDISTLPDLDTNGTIDNWLNTVTLKDPSQVSDLSTVKGILIGDSTTTLQSMERYEVIIDMKAPVKPLDESSTWKGEQGVNTFARYDDTTKRYLEVNPVKNILDTPKGDFKITKEDANGVKLSGAVFKLMNGDTVIAEAQSNSDGDVIFRDIDYGNYKLIEDIAPNGYIKSDTIYDVTVDDSSNTTTSLFTVKNSKIPAPEPGVTYILDITKTDETGAILPGTEFTLTNNRLNTVTTGTVDENGKLKFIDLESGYYTLTETKTINNHTPIKPMVININKDTVTNGIFSLNVINDRYNTYLTKIGMTDVSTKPDTELVPSDGTRLSNVRFELYKEGSNVKLGDYTTGLDGTINFKDLESNVIYELREISTQTGYALLPTSTKFKIGTDGKVYDINNNPYINGSLIIPNYKEKYKGNVSIIKENTVGQRLSNAEFAISKLDVATGKYTEINRGLTNSNGLLNFNDLTNGTYRIIETKAPAGYVKSNEVYNFTVDDRYDKNDFITKFINEPSELILHKVALLDTNENNLFNYLDDYPNAYVKNGKVYAELTGAEFRLEDRDGNIITPSSISEDKGYTEYKYNNIDSTKEYILTETVAPEGFDKISPMVIYGRELTSSSPTKEIYVENKKKVGIVSISKYRSKEGTVLEGAKFGLYQNGELLAEGTTDSKGNYTFKDIPLGSYIVKEIEAPQGYKLNPNEYNVEITDTQRLVTLTFLNDLANKNYTITKVDSENNPLSGAEFHLLRNGEIISTVISDINGKVNFGDVPLDGTYQVEEVTAPEGYRISSIQNVDILEDNKVITNYKATQELPMTGSYGLIPYTVGGGILLGLWLFTHKKRKKELK